jgi:hypothetical protein
MIGGRKLLGADPAWKPQWFDLVSSQTVSTSIREHHQARPPGKQEGFTPAACPGGNA